MTHITGCEPFRLSFPPATHLKSSTSVTDCRFSDPPFLNLCGTDAAVFVAARPPTPQCIFFKSTEQFLNESSAECGGITALGLHNNPFNVIVPEGCHAGDEDTGHHQSCSARE